MKRNLIFFLILFVLSGIAYSRNFLVGNVSDQFGGPVSNARIVLGNYTEGKGYGTPLIVYSDSDGKYKFLDILPGVQSIEFECEGYQQRGESIELKSGSNIFNIVLRKEHGEGNAFFDEYSPEDTIEFSGKVIDETTGEPIENAYVVFGDHIDRSDSKGHFSIKLKERQNRYLIISARKYEIYQKKTGVRNNLTIRMKRKSPYNEIYGQIIDKTTLMPLKDVPVKIGSRETKSGNDGKYFIKNIPAGEYPIIVQLDGYKEYSEIVNIYKGKQNYDILLEEAIRYGYVYGYLKKRSNLKPIPNALVAIGTTSVKTDEDGFFEMSGVPTGSTDIVVIFNGKEIYRSGMTVYEGKQQYDIIYTPGMTGERVILKSNTKPSTDSVDSDNAVPSDAPSKDDVDLNWETKTHTSY